MAKREKKARLYGTIGLISAGVSALGVLAVLAIVVPKWQFADNLIDLGTVRYPLALMGLFMTVALGFVGFLGGLEGAANGEGKVKLFGWVGFWIGVVCAMAGIILGLCVRYYSI